MGELRFVSVDRRVDPDVVTQEAEYEEEERVHPEGREDADGNDISGQQYRDLALPEKKGVATYTVVAEATGFREGERAQVDISTGDGYREAKIVDLPFGDEPQEITIEFGPGPVDQAAGLATILALPVDADGNLIGETETNAQGLVSWPELGRHVAIA